MVKTRILVFKKKVGVKKDTFRVFKRKANARKLEKKTPRIKPVIPALKKSQICTLSAASLKNGLMESRQESRFKFMV
jgi:hypothetical protein